MFAREIVLQLKPNVVKELPVTFEKEILPLLRSSTRLRLRQRIECLVSLEVGGGEVGPLFFCSNPGGSARN
jgi:hypothetical protein